MSYYPQPNSHIRTKIKVELHLSNYGMKKELDHATCVDRSDLPVKERLSGLESWSWQTRYYLLVNVLTSLNNLKTKGVDLDAANLKTVPVDRKN